MIAGLLTIYGIGVGLGVLLVMVMSALTHGGFTTLDKMKCFAFVAVWPITLLYYVGWQAGWWKGPHG